MKEGSFLFKLNPNGLAPHNLKVVQYVFLTVKIAASGHSKDATEITGQTTGVKIA